MSPLLYSETRMAIKDGLMVGARCKPSIAVGPARVPGMDRWPGQLLRLVSVLTTLMLVACVVVIGYGHLRPLSGAGAELGLAYCDSLPCFGGMIPGQTDWAAVTARFGKHPALPLTSPEGEIVFLPSSDGKVLGTVFVELSPNWQVTLGDLVALYGAPSSTVIYRRTGSLIVHYPFLYVVARLSSSVLSPDAPVKYIVLGNTADRALTDVRRCSREAFFEVTGEVDQIVQCPWQGFASLQHYLNPTYNP